MINPTNNIGDIFSNPWVLGPFLLIFTLYLLAFLTRAKWSLVFLELGLLEINIRPFFFPKNFKWEINLLKKIGESSDKKKPSKKSKKAKKKKTAAKKKSKKNFSFIKLLAFSFWRTHRLWLKMIQIRKLCWSHGDVETFGKGCAILSGLKGTKILQSTQLDFDFDWAKNNPVVKLEGMAYFGLFFLAIFLFLMQFFRYKFINFSL